MGLFEHWPYVNFHDLNLDWIIKEIPKVYASRDEAQANAEAAAESAAASQLSADASQASADASQLSAEASELSAGSSQSYAQESLQHANDAAETVSNTLNQINLLQSRVDNIIPEGTQTEGNTELIDIRVGADGTIYDSAGNAVRGQYTVLNNQLNAYQTKALARLSELDILVPLYAEVGDTLIFSTDDGSRFTPTQVRLFDGSEVQHTYWGVANSSSPVTKTVPSDKPKTYFVSISGGTAQNITIINQTRRNAQYNNDLAKEKIDELSAECDFIIDTVGVIPFALEKGSLNMTPGNDAPTESAYNIDMRGRTPVDTPLHLSAGDTISINTGYVGQFCYNAGQGLVKTDMGITNYVVPTESDVWFIIKPETETAGMVISLDTLIEQISVKAANNNSIIKRVIELESNEPHIPSYYVEHMTNKIASINASTQYINGVCFPFITDIHFSANSKNSKYLLKDVLQKTACDYVIAGGDYGVTGSTEEESREYISDLFDYSAYIGHEHFFALVGNHDFTGSETLTWGETYNSIIRPFERYVSHVSKAGHFCIDIEAENTRLICLNTSVPEPIESDTSVSGAARFGTEQIQYLVDRLSELTGYNIIVLSHIASDPAMPDYTSAMADIQSVLELFEAKGTGEVSGITINFSNVTNNLICHINGHAHTDAYHVQNGVLSICTTCDARYRTDGYGALAGTVTEQAFDVYCIDYDEETITAVRIGRGNNRQWKKINGVWTIVM